MGKPWESILVGYHRKLLKDGFPNHKLLVKFTEKYGKLHIEMVNGSLKPCVTRCRLCICTSVLFKYIDSGRIHQGDDTLRWDSHLKELRNKIMDKSLKMSERRQALYFFKFSSPIYEWKYYKRWYKVSY